MGKKPKKVISQSRGEEECSNTFTQEERSLKKKKLECVERGRGVRAFANTCEVVGEGSVLPIPKGRQKQQLASDGRASHGADNGGSARWHTSEDDLVRAPQAAC